MTTNVMLCIFTSHVVRTPGWVNSSSLIEVTAWPLPVVLPCHLLSLHTEYGWDTKFTVFFCSVTVFSARTSPTGMKFGTRHCKYPRQVLWNFGGDTPDMATLWVFLGGTQWMDMHFSNALLSLFDIQALCYGLCHIFVHLVSLSLYFL